MYNIRYCIGRCMTWKYIFMHFHIPTSFMGILLNHSGLFSLGETRAGAHSIRYLHAGMENDNASRILPSF